MKDVMSKFLKYNYTHLSHYDKSLKGKKFIAFYGIFYKEPDGTIKGYIENSSSMGWSLTETRAWSLDYAKGSLKALLKTRKYYGANRKNFFIYRLTKQSKNALITADWKQRKETLVQDYRNYTFRNIKFYVNKQINTGEVCKQHI